MCLSRECEGRTVKVYSGICQACKSIGSITECPQCADEFQITEGHIFVRNIK